MDEAYLKYYINQAGSGVGNFYSGPIYQRGIVFHSIIQLE